MNKDTNKGTNRDTNREVNTSYLLDPNGISSGISNELIDNIVDNPVLTETDIDEDLSCDCSDRTIAQENTEIRDTFAQCFLLPTWENEFCYWYRTPQRTTNMTTWESIQHAFKLTNAQLDNLKVIEKATNGRGRVIYTELSLRNKARIVKQLIGKEVVKTIGDTVQLHPSIVYGLNWWSPFMQGFMLSEWMHERLVEYDLRDIPSQREHTSVEEGARAHSWIVRRSGVGVE